MKSKVFKIQKNSLKLKIEIFEKSLFTSWKHSGSNEFTNTRKFNLEDINLAFDSVKPACTSPEIIEIEKFMFSTQKGEQLSLF